MKTGLAAWCMAAFLMAGATDAAAMSCGVSQRIDRDTLTKAVERAGGRVKSVSWTVGKAQLVGAEKKVELLPDSWVRFSSDGRWTGRIGLRNSFRVRPAVFRLSLGFALHGDSRSGLVPTVRTEPLSVPKNATRWIDISGKDGPKDVTFDVAAQGKTKPVWAVICAPGQ